MPHIEVTNMSTDLPTILTSSYASSPMFAADVMPFTTDTTMTVPDTMALRRQQRPIAAAVVPNQLTVPNLQDVKPQESAVTKRVVQIWIVDPHSDVPVESSLLYKSDPFLTDLTNQELYFEIDIKKRLDEHNEKRKKIVNKSIKDRTEFLEAARIRDLKMVVVDVASFG